MEFCAHTFIRGKLYCSYIFVAQKVTLSLLLVVHRERNIAAWQKRTRQQPCVPAWRRMRYTSAKRNFFRVPWLEKLIGGYVRVREPLKREHRSGTHAPWQLTRMGPGDEDGLIMHPPSGVSNNPDLVSFERYLPAIADAWRLLSYQVLSTVYMSRTQFKKKNNHQI